MEITSVDIKPITRAMALALAATLALGACAANETKPTPEQDSTENTGNTQTTEPTEAPEAGLSGTLNGMGSSAMAAAQNVWAAKFQNDHSDVTVNYDPQGSGAGRTAFAAGGVAFAGSDSAMQADKIDGDLPLCADDAGPVNLPVYISPIAIAYNLPEVEDLVVDAETLAMLFSGKITNWNDERLAALNEGKDMPDLPVTVVHRSDDSGTTHNFTQYLEATAGDTWGEPASQTFPFAIGDAAKGTSGVADAARAAHGSIAYIDLSGSSGLQTASLDLGDSVSSITAEGAAAVIAKSPTADTGLNADKDLAIDIDRTVKDEGSWPLVLVAYVIVCESYADAELGTLVKEYITHIASPEAQAEAGAEVGSAPLDPDLAARVLAVAEAIG